MKLPQDARNCHICRKSILKKLSKSKNYRKARDHCCYTGKYRDTAHSTCNLKFNEIKEIPAIFHGSSNYDYHFILKELATKFERKLGCLGENTEKYKTFLRSNRKRSYKS